MEHRLSATVFLTGPLWAGTTVGGQFGWGGTPLKRYQGRPKVGSGGTEPAVECKGKSQPDWILNSKGSRGESRA